MKLIQDSYNTHRHLYVPKEILGTTGTHRIGFMFA